MTSNNEPVLIFDLDGTILSINSFPYWVRYMLRGHFGGLRAGQRLAVSLRTGLVLAERKLLRRTHYRAKRELQEIWAWAVKKDPAQLAALGMSDLLQHHVRPNLHGVMDAVAERRVDALLATASAGDYAQPLGQALGFHHILATPLSGDADTLENIRERKRDRVLALLEAKGWQARPRVFFTDHEEDLPLICECPRTLWFGRNEELPAIQASAPQTEVIACRDVPDAEIVRLIGG